MSQSRTAAIVTSRLRRLVGVNDVWLSGLRAAHRKIQADGARLVVGDQTAGSDFVRHLATRTSLPYEKIADSPLAGDLGYDLPSGDRVVIEAAEVVYVLGLRSNGNLHRLLRYRLEQQIGKVVLVDLPDLQPKSVRKELCNIGAHPWEPTEFECRPLLSATCKRPSSNQPEASMPRDDQSMNASTILISSYVANQSALSWDQPLACPSPVDSPLQCAIDKPDKPEAYPTLEPAVPQAGWEFLTHTTRSCPGPWPGESFETYVDSLLEARQEADHSPLGALRRIVCQRRLSASGRLIRGGYQVVSLTACSLDQLPTLRKFRPHRVHWDFEPFGICIRRNWLEERGVRPVHYCDDVGWKTMSEAERPFFQLAMGKSAIDWTIEREWRHLGDLDLSELTPDDVLLFVPNFESAKSLATVTQWPITLWPCDDVLH